MEAAFWHRYPQLHQISTGFLDHLSNALRQRLKEKVGDLVLKAWACVEVVKAECKEKSIEEFRAVLDRDTTRLLQVSASDADTFVVEFFDEQVKTTLHSLLSVYPLATGVISTAIGLTRRQKGVSRKGHMDYFSTYAKKKVKEVCLSSIQQRVKSDASNAPSRDTTGPDSSRLLEGRSTDDDASRKETYILLGDVCGGVEALHMQLTNELNDLCDEQSVQLIGGSVRIRCAGADRLTREEIVTVFLTESCALDIEMPTSPVSRDVNSITLHAVTCFCGHLCTTVAQIVITVGKLSLLTPSDRRKLVPNDSMRQLVCNCVNLIMCSLIWCHQVRSECGDFDCTGRVRIEVMKMLTLIGNSLFYFDQIATTEVMDAHWQHFKLKVPTDVLIESCRLEVINVEGFSGVITAALKSSLYSAFSGSSRDAVLNCLSRFLCLKSEELSLDLYIDIDEGMWLADPGVKRTVKTNISAELAYVIDLVAVAKL